MSESGDTFKSAAQPSRAKREATKITKPREPDSAAKKSRVPADGEAAPSGPGGNSLLRLFELPPREKRGSTIRKRESKGVVKKYRTSSQQTDDGPVRYRPKLSEVERKSIRTPEPPSRVPPLAPSNARNPSSDVEDTSLGSSDARELSSDTEDSSSDDLDVGYNSYAPDEPQQDDSSYVERDEGSSDEGTSDAKSESLQQDDSSYVERNEVSPDEGTSSTKPESPQQEGSSYVQRNEVSPDEGTSGTKPESPQQEGSSYVQRNEVSLDEGTPSTKPESPRQEGSSYVERDKVSPDEGTFDAKSGLPQRATSYVKRAKRLPNKNTFDTKSKLPRQDDSFYVERDGEPFDEGIFGAKSEALQRDTATPSEVLYATPEIKLSPVKVEKSQEEQIDFGGVEDAGNFGFGSENFNDDFDKENSSAGVDSTQNEDGSDTDTEDESAFFSFSESGKNLSASKDIERTAFEDQLFIDADTENPAHSAAELQVLASLSSIANSAQNDNDPTHNDTYQRLMRVASKEIHAHHRNLIRTFKQRPGEEQIVDALAGLLRRFSTVVSQAQHREELEALSVIFFAHVDDPYSEAVLDAILKVQGVIREIMKHSADPKLLLYYTWADRLALRWLIQRDMHELKLERRKRMMQYAVEIRKSRPTRMGLEEAREVERRAGEVGHHRSHSLHYFKSVLNFVESGKLTFDWDEPQCNMGLSLENKLNILDKVTLIHPEHYARTVVSRFLVLNNMSEEWKALFDITRMFILEVQGAVGIQQPWAKNKDPELVDMIIDASTRPTSVISLDHTTFPVHLMKKVLDQHKRRDGRPNMEELEAAIRALFPASSPWRYYDMSTPTAEDAIDVTWLMHNVFVVPPEAPVMRPTRMSVEAELQTLGIDRDDKAVSMKVVHMLSRILCPELYSTVTEALKYYTSNSVDKLTVSDWSNFIRRPYSTQLVCAMYLSNKMNNNSFTTKEAKQDATKRLFTAKALFANPSDPLGVRYAEDDLSEPRKGNRGKKATRRDSSASSPIEWT